MRWRLWGLGRSIFQDLARRLSLCWYKAWTSKAFQWQKMNENEKNPLKYEISVLWFTMFPFFCLRKQKENVIYIIHHNATEHRSGVAVPSAQAMARWQKSDEMNIKYLAKESNRHTKPLLLSASVYYIRPLAVVFQLWKERFLGMTRRVSRKLQKVIQNLRQIPFLWSLALHTIGRMYRWMWGKLCRKSTFFISRQIAIISLPVIVPSSLRSNHRYRSISMPWFQPGWKLDLDIMEFLGQLRKTSNCGKVLMMDDPSLSVGIAFQYIRVGACSCHGELLQLTSIENYCLNHFIFGSGKEDFTVWNQHPHVMYNANKFISKLF